MPKKIRELIKYLKKAGFYEISGGRKIMKAVDCYHKWIEWSEEDHTYIGKCPDLITGIHGDDPVKLYRELCEVAEDVIQHFKSEGRTLPIPYIRPMGKVA